MDSGPRRDEEPDGSRAAGGDDDCVRSGRGAENGEPPLPEHAEWLPGPPGGEVKPPVPHRADDARAELEQAQADGAERGRRERRACQGPQAEEVQQIAGQGVEQEPKGIGTKDVTGEPIGGEIPLELLDEVLGLAALVILGEHVRAAAPVRDDEADVGPLRGVLDHREHTPGPRPAAGLVADARN